jgi:hypothetical protein
VSESNFHEKFSFGNQLIPPTTISDSCRHLDKEDLAIILDSEYRSPVTIHGGITVQQGYFVCQQSSSLSFSIPLGATATGVIPLHRTLRLLPFR